MPSLTLRHTARRAGGVLLATLGALAIEAATDRAALAQAINPVYQTTFTESQGLAPSTEQPGVYLDSTYAFFFDTENDGSVIDALGLAQFDDWLSRPAPSPYTVTLWRYNGLLNPESQYTPLASVTFDPLLADTYRSEAGYWWIPITPVSLGAATASNPSEGFAVGATGNFGETEPGNGIPANLTVLFGADDFTVGSFAPGYAYDGNGFNTLGSVYYPDAMPFPEDYLSIPEEANDPLTYYGYFNANASFALVPGPLPLMGAAAAFGWSRQLRRRLGGGGR